VPVIRLHGPRHTAAARMLDSGTTVSATAKWLGHDPAMTLRFYGHVYDDALAPAGDVQFDGTPRATSRCRRGWKYVDCLGSWSWSTCICRFVVSEWFLVDGSDSSRRVRGLGFLSHPTVARELL
jgi:hypothetical protein